jgi:hypothetical protein
MQSVASDGYRQCSAAMPVTQLTQPQQSITTATQFCTASVFMQRSRQHGFGDTAHTQVCRSFDNPHESPRPNPFSRSDRTEERLRFDCVDRPHRIVRWLRRDSWLRFRHRRLVLGVAQADMAPAIVDLRAGLDDPIRHDGDRALARPTRTQRRSRLTRVRDMVIRHPIFAEFALDAYIFWVAPAFSRIYRDLSSLDSPVGHAIVVRKDTRAGRLSSRPLPYMVYVRSRTERYSLADECLNHLAYVF